MKKIKYVIISIFVFSALFIGSNHEPWVDEAQSWLIARDASLSEIFFNISSYEGTFPLWFLTLKFFIKLGFSYDKLYIISIIISSIALWLFLNKDDLPIYIRILLPFSYWIFYQYTIIARSYCYLFLAFSLLLYTYPKRNEKIYLYILNLILFSFISMHGLLIALVLGGMQLVNLLKTKDFKNLICVSIILLSVFSLELYILLPEADLYMAVNVSRNIKNILISMFEIIIVYKANVFFVVQNILVLLVFIIWFIKFSKNIDKIFYILLITMVGFFCCIRGVSHHFGIIFLIIVFTYLLNYEKMKNDKKLKILTIVMLGLYSIYSVQSSVNDWKLNYSGSKEMADYIKNIDYENVNIYGIGYKSTSLLPYFEKSVYSNKTETYYKWSVDNKDWYTYNNLKKITKWDELFSGMPEYILLGEHDISKEEVKKIKSIIESNGQYELDYKTSGYNFFKNYYSETEGFLLYKKKE